MEGVGWDITPSGWILLFIIAVLIGLYIVERLPLPPNENQANLT